MPLEKIRNSLCAVVLLLALFSAPAASAGEDLPEGKTQCTMKFNLSGWSIFYETASGSGTIRCDNGQRAKVRLKVNGGGITAGKYTLRGDGNFSEVYDISDLFGAYAAAEAHAGVMGSSGAQVMTNGSVSLAIKALGSGVNLGVSFTGFRIEPYKRRR